jgi:hypothetical protein
MPCDELPRTWKLLVAVVQPYVGEQNAFFWGCVRVEIVLRKSNLFFFLGSQARRACWKVN